MSGRLPLNPLSNSKINAINSSSPSKNHVPLNKQSSLKTTLKPGSQLKFNGAISVINRVEPDNTVFYKRRLLSTKSLSPNPSSHSGSSSSTSSTSTSSLLTSPNTRRAQRQPSVLKNTSLQIQRNNSTTFAVEESSTTAVNSHNNNNNNNNNSNKMTRVPSISLTMDSLPPLTHCFSNADSFIESIAIPKIISNKPLVELNKPDICEKIDFQTVCNKLKTRLLLAHYKYETNTTNVKDIIRNEQEHYGLVTPKKQKIGTMNSDNRVTKSGSKKRNTVGLHRGNKSVTPGRVKAAKSLLQLYGSSYN